MKPILLLFCLFYPLILASQEVYPGPHLGWRMALESGLGFSYQEQGGTISAGFGVDSLFQQGWFAEIHAAMRYQGTEELAPPVLTPLLRLGWDFFLGPLAFRPFLHGGLSTDLDLITYPVYGGGLTTGVHLRDGMFLELMGQVELRTTGDPILLLGLRFSHHRLFPLELPPPSAQIVYPTGPFSPDGDGTNDLYVLEITPENPDSLYSWELEISNPQGEIFWKESGIGFPPAQWEWDGIGVGEEMVSSASQYLLELTLVDILGREESFRHSLLVDVLVELDGDRYRIRIPTFVFPANSTDFEGFSQEDLIRENRWILNQLVRVLEQFPTYGISIEGHANPVYYDDPVRGREERAVLERISLSRAQVVKDALVELGLDPDRLTIRGMGASDILAPPGDEEKNWKNRRVEFILERP